MSHNRTDVLFEQRLLKCGGFYIGELDGLWGKQTQEAETQAKKSFYDLSGQLGIFDSRSEACIETLMPKGQRMARAVMNIATIWAKQHQMSVRVLSGTRTYAEQDQLFTQKPTVTKARGGQSNHNFGLAVDIGLFEANGRYMTGSAKGDEAAYSMLGKAVIAQLGSATVDWGGLWKSITDCPHYGVATGMTMAALKKAFESGQYNGK